MMFYNREEILKQFESSNPPPRITIGDDISDTASATKEILNKIEAIELSQKKEAAYQNIINGLMLFFTVIAAIGGVAGAVISYISLKG